MAYLKVYSNWLPYVKLNDKRGFISKRFGGGHTGIDSVGNVYANQVYAIIDGEVTASYFDSKLGNVVKYKRSNVEIAYYHLASRKVNIGDKVVFGETVVGVEGNTGTASNGKHLHTSMWIDGILTDPEPYLSGSKAIEIKEENSNKGAKYMIRQVTKVLNLRSSRSTKNSTNIVYKDMPVGTIFLVTEVVREGNDDWGHIYVTINGKSYVGWAKTSTTWSKEV